MMDELIEFIETDIVVYQGAITKYGVIKPLLNGDNEDVRLATTEELERYINRPEK